MEAGPQLVLRSGEQSAQVDPGGLCVIGRSPKAGLHVDDRTVSRTHAQVSVSAGKAWITDLGSKRGTFMNGQQIRRSTQLQIPTTINLGGPEGVAVVIGEYGQEDDPRAKQGEAAVTGGIIATLQHRPAVIAGVLATALIAVFALSTLWPGGPSPQDQLVLVTIQPETAPTQTGVAVIVDGHHRLVAVPHGAQDWSRAAFLVQLPLKDGLVFEVAAVRVAEGHDVDILQLIGTEAVPELASSLDDFGTIGLADLGSSPGGFWTYGVKEDEAPGPIRESLSITGSGQATAQPRHDWAFAPIVEGKRVVGFVTAGCTREDGTLSYDLVGAGGAQEDLNNAVQRANSVGPAPVPVGLRLAYTPPKCPGPDAETTITTESVPDGSPDASDQSSRTESTRPTTPSEAIDWQVRFDDAVEGALVVRRTWEIRDGKVTGTVILTPTANSGTAVHRELVPAVAFTNSTFTPEPIDTNGDVATFLIDQASRTLTINFHADLTTPEPDQSTVQSWVDDWRNRVSTLRPVDNEEPAGATITPLTRGS